MPKPDELDRTEPIIQGSPLDTLLRSERPHLDVRARARELAKDIDFAIDVTEPREVLLARFQELIEAAFLKLLVSSRADLQKGPRT